MDRLVRGRAWIPLLGLMLAGIVAMQVELLKLSASMGRSIDRGTSLLSQNEQLRASVASLADDQRIERVAARMGMIMPAPDGVTFLAARRGADVRGALASMRPPSASASSAPLAASAAAPPGASAPTNGTPTGTTDSAGSPTATTGSTTGSSTGTGSGTSVGSGPGAPSTGGAPGSAGGAPGAGSAGVALASGQPAAQTNSPAAP